jgi:hypothetical protein
VVELPISPQSRRSHARMSPWLPMRIPGLVPIAVLQDQRRDRKLAPACSAELVVGLYEKTDADSPLPIYYGFAVAFPRCI